jgi:hypothetical protein
MAEIIAVAGAVSTVFSIGSSIVSAINGLVKTGQIISEIKNAPLEAKHIANQLDAAKTILTSMRSSLDTVPRSQDFLKVWGSSAQLVLSNIETTMTQIQKKLCEGGFLGLKKRFQWRYEKAEAHALQQTLQGYMQMLGLVQNGLLQYVGLYSFRQTGGANDARQSKFASPSSVRTQDRKYHKQPRHLNTSCEEASCRYL